MIINEFEQWMFLVIYTFQKGAFLGAKTPINVIINELVEEENEVEVSYTWNKEGGTLPGNEFKVNISEK